jgi:hypothetical protein
VTGVSRIPASNSSVNTSSPGAQPPAGTPSSLRDAAASQRLYQTLSAQGVGGQPKLSAGGALERRGSEAHSKAGGLYGFKGINEGQARYIQSDEPVHLQPYAASESAGDGTERASQRRSAPNAGTLEWYLLDGGAPQIDLPVPFFLYQVAHFSV